MGKKERAKNTSISFVMGIDTAVDTLDSLLVCGDLNATAENTVVQRLLQHGLHDAYAARPGEATCNANASARRIDFILHGNAFEAEACPLPRIDEHTVLPSVEQPSDHLAIRAHLRWRDPATDDAA